MILMSLTIKVPADSADHPDDADKPDDLDESDCICNNGCVRLCTNVFVCINPNPTPHVVSPICIYPYLYLQSE